MKTIWETLRFVGFPEDPGTVLLRCSDHPEWESDVTGMTYLDVTHVVIEHGEDRHGAGWSRLGAS